MLSILYNHGNMYRTSLSCHHQSKYAVVLLHALQGATSSLFRKHMKALNKDSTAWLIVQLPQSNAGMQVADFMLSHMNFRHHLSCADIAGWQRVYTVSMRQSHPSMQAHQ